MIAKIITAFPKLVENKCFSVQNTDFGIRDDQDKEQEPSYIVFEIEEAHFKVKNPTGKEIHFIAIDKCLWKDSDDIGKKCDCIIFDDTSFFFIEIKNPKIGRQGNHRKKAEIQLHNTIKAFQSEINVNQYDIYAIICFVKNNSPKLTTGSQNMKAFWDNYDITLYERNHWEFQ